MGVFSETSHIVCALQGPLKHQLLGLNNTVWGCHWKQWKISAVENPTQTRAAQVCPESITKLLGTN